MGNITINSNITGGGGGGTGDVGGASNLTTVGAIPYVSAAGILNQDPTALFWDAANDRLGVGTSSFYDANTKLQVSSPSIASLIVESTSGAKVRMFAGGIGLMGTLTNHEFRLRVNDADRVTIATTGNVLIGTTTDSNFKLDVASSGSSGTLRVYDQTATTGVTKAVIRAGAGQSTTNLTEWQNSAGTTVLLSIGPGGVISAQGNVLGITNTAVSTIQFASTYGLGWSSTGTYGGAKDVAITRNAAGVIEVNNGTAGTYRDLILRRSQHNGVTVADLPAAAAGNAGSIQYVTDANATTIGSTVAGGGANKVMVWSDGAAWKIFAS